MCSAYAVGSRLRGDSVPLGSSLTKSLRVHQMLFDPQTQLKPPLSCSGLVPGRQSSLSVIARVFDTLNAVYKEHLQKASAMSVSW